MLSIAWLQGKLCSTLGSVLPANNSAIPFRKKQIATKCCKMQGAAPGGDRSIVVLFDFFSFAGFSHLAFSSNRITNLNKKFHPLTVLEHLWKNTWLTSCFLPRTACLSSHQAISNRSVLTGLQFWGLRPYQDGKIIVWYKIWQGANFLFYMFCYTYLYVDQEEHRLQAKQSNSSFLSISTVLHRG